MHPTGDPATGAGRTSVTPAIRHARVRRPNVVTILAGLELFNALGYLAALLAALNVARLAVPDVLSGTLAGLPINILSGVGLILALVVLLVAGTAAGILLLRMRQTGWTVTMLLTGLGLATQIYLYWTNEGVSDLWLLLNVLTVFYLNQRQVREAFGIGPGPMGTEIGEAHP